MRVAAPPQTDRVPIVLEALVEIRPGPFEVVAVALDLTSDTVGSFTLRGEWPDPAKAVAVGSVVALQRERGLFLRGDDRASEGLVVVTSDRPATAGTPTVIDSMICGHRRANHVRVQRSLEGAQTYTLPESFLSFDGVDTCTTIHDELAGDTVLPGILRFTVEAHAEDGGTFKRACEFRAVGER